LIAFGAVRLKGDENNVDRLENDEDDGFSVFGMLTNGEERRYHLACDGGVKGDNGGGSLTLKGVEG